MAFSGGGGHNGCLCGGSLLPGAAAGAVSGTSASRPWVSGNDGVTCYLATATEPLPYEVLTTITAAPHAESARLLRDARRELHPSINLPLLGRVRIRTLALPLIVGAGAGWWLTPWAPVRALVPSIDDPTSRLAAELAAPMIVLFDDQRAVVQPPVLPGDLRSQASRVRDNAPPYLLVLRAMVLGNFAEARHAAHRNHRTEAEEIDPGQLQIMLAQVEMYDGRFIAAENAYAEALRIRPDDPAIWCQLAAATIQAGQFERVADVPGAGHAGLPHKPHLLPTVRRSVG